MKNLRREIIFRDDNCDYSVKERAALNNELSEYIGDAEPYSDIWYELAKCFSDKVSRR